MNKPSTFPCGLVQAPNAFNSSIDALLLAYFALRFLKNGQNFVELGAGNGMVSCAMGLAMPKIQGIGLELMPELTQVAMDNAQNLNLQNTIFFASCDIAKKSWVRALVGMDNDLVLANPPYHTQNCGYLRKHKLQNVALHQGENTLQSFCQAAFTVLKNKGHFCCIYLASKIHELLSNLEQAKFGIGQILPVYTRPIRSAQWVIVQARKNVGTNINFMTGLTLYAENKGTDFSEQAKDFLGKAITK